MEPDNFDPREIEHILTFTDFQNTCMLHNEFEPCDECLRLNKLVRNAMESEQAGREFYRGERWKREKAKIEFTEDDKIRAHALGIAL